VFKDEVEDFAMFISSVYVNPFWGGNYKGCYLFYLRSLDADIEDDNDKLLLLIIFDNDFSLLNNVLDVDVFLKYFCLLFNDLYLILLSLIIIFFNDDYNY
jgi:hypothetical protein